MKPDPEQEFDDRQIVVSWGKNASPWITAIRENQITTRVRLTNQAIIDAVLQHRPAKVLDIGCGEGWLARQLSAQGIDVLGIDVIPALVTSASQAGQGRYETLAYEALSYERLNEKFDVLVCNFSLIGKESVAHIFQQAPNLLSVNGRLIVQTLHPESATGELPYTDGWRHGSWAGFSEAFCDPAPWYFRTLESWQRLFVTNGFLAPTLTEVAYSATDEPVSIIFTGTLPL